MSESNQVLPIITHTSEEFHGANWHTIASEIEAETLTHFIQDAIENGQVIDLESNEESVSIVTSDNTRLIVQNDDLVSAFPFFKSEQRLELDIEAIQEWSNVNGLEAVVTAIDPSGYEVDFFASDYAMNADIYQEESPIVANLTGMAYILEEFNAQAATEIEGLEYSADCSDLIPTEESATYVAIGLVKKITKHNLGHVAGYIVTLDSIIDYELEIFVADFNLKTELTIDQHVYCTIWMTGSIE